LKAPPIGIQPDLNYHTLGGTPLFRAAFLSLFFAAAMAAQDDALAGRVGNTGFVQLTAESFAKLSPREQALAYWLSQASIATDPIIYGQMSRFGLRQKRLLESILENTPTHPKSIVDFAMLFWANKGNHNELTSQKFLPECTFEEFKAAAGPKLAAEVDALKASLFDPDFERMITAKSPRGALDILQASSNDFYSAGLSLVDIQGFHERYPLNSRLAKGPDGKLREEVYRAGTPDGKVPPGLYAEYLRRANSALEHARAYAAPPQAAAIGSLIRFYQTGDPHDWVQFGIDWVRDNPAVDFDNGFIEVYRDARGAKGSSQSFVTVTDEALASRMRKLSDNAQYFEDHAPWLAEYKMQGVKPPVAKAVEALIETGDFHVSTIGDNLPNENEVHEKYGSKSFMFTGSIHALEHATGSGPLDEFAASPEEIALGRKYGDEAGALVTALHEVIGHGSGKLSPKLTHEPSYYLKEYFSTLEEARADLMALWNAFDPKLRELGLVSSPDVGKAMYDSAARTVLMQLRRILKGDTIEEDHQRGRQLIVRYIMDKTGAIEQIERGGKTYMAVRDYDKMHQGVGMLLAELMRIKAEGDYDAIKALVDRYGVHFDPKVRDRVVSRYAKLNIPTYWAGINPQLTASFAADGKVVKVTMSYPRDYMRQQLDYSAENQPSR
jgi:dipeptidyl-peptidase-3